MINTPEAAELKVSRTVTYNTILRKGGSGRVKVQQIPLFRRLKEVALVRLRRMVAAS